MHHLVFVPSAHLSGATVEEQLSAVGLADHAAGAQTIQEVGPGEQPGTLFGWNATNGRLHYKPEQQTWLPAVPSENAPAGRYSVGVWNDSPPTPEDLRRSAVLHGDDVTLGDEQPWHVPAPAFLPHDLILQDDGSLRHEPKRRYQDVCLEAHRMRNRLRGEVRGIEYTELWRFCLKCLSLNYRLPPELASHLRLIDTENVKSVMLAALKWSED